MTELHNEEVSTTNCIIFFTYIIILRSLIIFHRSIGLFCHSEEPGELRLVRGCTVNIDTVGDKGIWEFFATLASHILPPDMGGQFDVFVPLATSGKTPRLSWLIIGNVVVVVVVCSYTLLLLPHWLPLFGECYAVTKLQ